MSTSTPSGDLVLTRQSSSAVEISCAVTSGTTNAFRNRALAVQLKKETAKATVKEVDVVHRGLRRVETRMHELESRVQYVNPWVVQYMWELLCELREKIGVQYSHQKECAWVEDMQKGTRNGSGRRPTTGSRLTAFSTPQGEVSKTAATMLSVPTTPVQLFEGSKDMLGKLDTSLSSESDDSDNSPGTVGVEGLGKIGSGCSIEQDRDFCGNKEGKKSTVVLEKCRLRTRKSEHRLTRLVEKMEWRWKCYRLADEECASRVQLALEETTYRNLILSKLTCVVASTAQQRHVVASSLRPSGSLVDDAAGPRATQLHARHRGSGMIRKGRGKCNELAGLSLLHAEFPDGLSPIDPLQSPSDFLSPQTGMEIDMCGERSSSSVHEGSRQGERSDTDGVGDCRQHLSRVARGCDVSTLSHALLNNPDFMRKLADSVSRHLAAMIQKSDISANCGGSPTQGLPSALMLIVRDTVDAFFSAHDKVFSNKMQDYLAKQQENHNVQKEQLWRCVAEQEDAWTRRSVAEEQKSTELLQEHRRLVSMGKRDAESCGEVHKELLRLCGEVVRAVEQIPDRMPVEPQPNGDVVSSRILQSDDRNCDRIELHLETLSAAVDGLYADMEAMRARELTATTGTDLSSRKREDEENRNEEKQWHRQAVGKITALQESVKDIQNALAVIAQKSREAEKRLDSSKADNSEFIAWRERLQGLEKQLEMLPSLLGTLPPPPLPPPVKSVLASNVSDRSSDPMSIEDALMNVQRILLSQDVNKASPVNPHIKAITSLCAALQQVNHLYNAGTGTFGGSLQLIFAMPPFSVPQSLTNACRSYLRQHSVAELREAMEAFGIGTQVAKVLSDCYYWMQSHVLVMSEGEGEPLHSARNDVCLTSVCQRETGVTSSGSIAPTVLTKEATFLQPVARITRHNAEVQTEFEELASSPSLSLKQQQKQPIAHATSLDSDQQKSNNSCSDNSGDQQHRQTAAAPAPAASTPLEILAADRSPETVEPSHNAVHYYHHHHNCSSDGGVHGFIPHCVPAGGVNAGFLNTELHAGEVRRRHSLRMKHHQESEKCVRLPQPGANYDGLEREAAPTISSANSFHMCADRRKEQKIERVTRTERGVSDSLPVPSMFDEYLPLPTAISSFTAPQETRPLVGCSGSFPLKNPQPFYTASVVSQHSQEGHFNHVGDTTSAGRGKTLADMCNVRGGRMGDGDRCNKTHHNYTSPQYHSNILSISTRDRDDILTGAMASELHSNLSLCNGEKLAPARRKESKRF